MSNPLTPGFLHGKQRDADTEKGMVHLTLVSEVWFGIR